MEVTRQKRTSTNRCTQKDVKYLLIFHWKKSKFFKARSKSKFQTSRQRTANVVRTNKLGMFPAESYPVEANAEMSEDSYSQ